MEVMRMELVEGLIKSRQWLGEAHETITKYRVEALFMSVPDNVLGRLGLNYDMREQVRKYTLELIEKRISEVETELREMGIEP
jgi:hypothetical protein